MARYYTREQPDGLWSVVDKDTKEPVEAHGFRFINLEYEKAKEEAEALNNPEE